MVHQTTIVPRARVVSIAAIGIAAAVMLTSTGRAHRMSGSGSGSRPSGSSSPVGGSGSVTSGR